jgi:thiol-disulfide isomerase/thioredoxin
MRSRFPTLSAVILLAALLALAGCGGSGSDAPAGDGAGGPGGGDPVAPAEALREFTGEKVGGGSFDGASLAGKPTALWFWAPWCPTCLGQAPGVRKAVEQHADRVNIIGVAGLDKAEAMPDFVRMAKVETMPHVSDPDGKLWKTFEVREQSTFVLLDATGKVVFQGKLSADEVPDRIAALAG